MTKAMGRWISVRRQWYDISVRNCSVCGKMLPGDVWSVDIAGRSHAFCDPECEELYWQYWRPRYGGLDGAEGSPGQSEACRSTSPDQAPSEGGMASPTIENG